VSRTPAALADDCARAVLVVTLRIAPSDCAAMVLDRRALRNGGATALRWGVAGFEVTAARPPGSDRPWAREHDPVRPAITGGPAATVEQSNAPPPAPDIDAEP
jgi:competence protein ComEC